MRAVLFGLVLVVCSCSKKDTTPVNNVTSETATSSAATAAATNTPDKGGLSGTAELSPVHDVSKIGAKFELREVNGKDVEVKGKVSGMEPGKYVLHYHHPKGCFPTTGDEKEMHIGELGVIEPDATGSADVTLTIADARLGGMSPITSNCLIIFSADGSTFLSYGKIYGQPLGIGH